MINNSILKIIVKECCRSLSYNDEERQFSFALRQAQYKIWERIKGQLQEIAPDLYLNEFNNILSNLTDAVNRFQRIPFIEFPDAKIMNGEVLELGVSSGKTIVYVKMEDGQYLDVITGKGYSMGAGCRYKIGNSIVTSEGVDLGRCTSISLRVPQKEHISLSSHFIGAYYKRPISPSLWDIYDKATSIRMTKCPTECATICKNLLKMAKESGINSFSLLNILKGASSVA